MSNLQYRQSKIQERRKQTPRREFVMEIASRQPLNLYKQLYQITRYPKTIRSPQIINAVSFEKERDTLTQHGLDYDPDRGFGEQCASLFRSINIPALLTYGGNENADFSDGAYSGKNIYLTFLTTFGCENICYSMSIKDNCKNIYGSIMVAHGSENVYQSFGIVSSFNIFYSKYIENSSNIWFCTNCIGCTECINCNNLTNQSYYINNQEHSKDEYYRKKNQILSQKEIFDKLQSQLTTNAINVESDDCSGSFLTNCHHVEQGVAVVNLDTGRNVAFIQSKEANQYMYDSFMCGRSTHFYGAFNAGGFSEHLYCSGEQGWNSHMYYTLNMDHCSFCLGCIGLKNKSYCILNKQYSKEERYKKVDEIFAQMETDGTLGQFFPATMNPFYFNDTAAYLIDPSFTKEEVTAAGYLWRDEPIKVDIPVGATLVSTDELGQYEGRKDVGTNGNTSNKERYIDKEIMKKIIQDEQGNVYRVVPMEYDFLMKYGLPLPRKHWLDRMRENFRIS